MRIGPLAALVAVFPVVIVIAGMLWVAIGERQDRNPLGAPPFRNSAEAAAAGDAATMLRLLRGGENPSWVHQVRAEFISSSLGRVTTLEAALSSRHIAMIRVLEREGAIVDHDQRRQLACLARDLDLPHVAHYLAPEQTCVPGAALERISARSRAEVAVRD